MWGDVQSRLNECQFKCYEYASVTLKLTNIRFELLFSLDKRVVKLIYKFFV